MKSSKGALVSFGVLLHNLILALEIWAAYAEHVRMAIKKQEFYEGAALHLLARSGAITSINTKRHSLS